MASGIAAFTQIAGGFGCPAADRRSAGTRPRCSDPPAKSVRAVLSISTISVGRNPENSAASSQFWSSPPPLMTFPSARVTRIRYTSLHGAIPQCAPHLPPRLDAFSGLTAPSRGSAFAAAFALSSPDIQAFLPLCSSIQPSNAFTTSMSEPRRWRGVPHERPHKPLLLLAAFDLIDSGLAVPDRIPWCQELRGRFTARFLVVRKHNDQNNRISPSAIWQETVSGRPSKPTKNTDSP
jgi:hypothetical protein